MKFVALFLAAGALLYADEALPKPEALLDKFIEVTGGKANHAKVKTEITEGTLEMAAQGVKGKLTIYRAAPNKMATEMEFEGIGKIEEVVDGTHAWERSAIQGTRVKEGDELDTQLRLAAVDAAVEWRKYYPKVETTGTEVVDRATCYNVKLTPPAGKPETRCFDQKSGLMVKSTMTVKTPMGEIPAESYFVDYRQEGDLLVPHKLVQKAMGAEIVMLLDKITVNAEIPADKFAMPADVKALLEKGKAPPAAAKPEAAKPEPAPAKPEPAPAKKQ